MLRVLVVDDDPSVRKMVLTCLEKAGHEGREAWNGQDAIDQLDGGFHPDVILLDLCMPIMTGAELIEALKKRNRHPPLVVMSAYMGMMAFDAGVVADQVEKPFTARSLLERVESAALAAGKTPTS
jgi:CheY-like chemotaxis protein